MVSAGARPHSGPVRGRALRVALGVVAAACTLALGTPPAGAQTSTPVRSATTTATTTATTATTATEVAAADRGQAVVRSAAPAPAAVAAAATPRLGTLPATGTPSFQSLDPTRILDTRGGLGAPKAPVGQNASIDLKVTGVAGVPADGVSAVVLNVTVTAPTAGGYVTVYPSGQAKPNASSVNFVKGQTVANLVVATVGTGGKVSFYNAIGSTQVIADVQGYFAGGSQYAPLTPARVLDTRGGVGAPKARVGQGATISVPVLNRGGVPASGVSAVVLNVTAVNPSKDTYVSVFPAGGTRPGISNLNPAAGRNVAVAVFAQPGTGGAVSLWNAIGSVDLIADVTGYFTNGGQYRPVTPTRMFDSRGSFGRLGPGQAADMQVTGYDGVPVTGASAVVLSITAVLPSAGGYITEYPYGQPLAKVSNINFAAGATTPNLVVAKVGAGGYISVYNALGDVHFIVDVMGYLTTDATPQASVSQSAVASVRTDGTAGSAEASGTCASTVSQDGRYVLFTSADPALAAHYIPPASSGGGIYVRDLVLGVTSAVALPTAPGEQFCSYGLSADGRWALWSSNAALFAEDTNGTTDVFQTDLTDGLTYLVSWNSTAEASGNGASTVASQSADGRYVAFQSVASNLDPGDTDTAQDVYLIDMEGSGAVVHVGKGGITNAAVSDDGDVAFTATAAVTGLAGLTSAPVLYDRSADSYTNVAVPTTVGQPAPTSGSSTAYLSQDGLAVSFTTTAALTTDDGNASADAYVRRLGGTPSTTLVSRSAGNAPLGSSSAGPVAQEAGWSSPVAIFSSAQNGVVAGQTSGGSFSFRWAGAASTWATAAPGGTQPNGASTRASLSRDGRWASYVTSAGNITGGTGDRAVVTRVG